jgi:hypothetical protein
MPAPHLKLKLELPDDCWILTATAASETFSVQGRTGINPKLLIQFADALGAYPITAERTPELLAGSVRDGKLLEAGHDFVRITILPATARGLLQARIGLGEVTSHPDDAGSRSDSWDRIRNSQLDHPPYFPYYRAIGVAFPVNYQAVADFASALRGVVHGTAEDASLHAAFL